MRIGADGSGVGIAKSWSSARASRAVQQCALHGAGAARAPQVRPDAVEARAVVGPAADDVARQDRGRRAARSAAPAPAMATGSGIGRGHARRARLRRPVRRRTPVARSAAASGGGSARPARQAAAACRRAAASSGSGASACRPGSRFGSVGADAAGDATRLAALRRFPLKACNADRHSAECSGSPVGRRRLGSTDAAAITASSESDDSDRASWAFVVRAAGRVLQVCAAPSAAARCGECRAEPQRRSTADEGPPSTRRKALRGKD